MTEVMFWTADDSAIAFGYQSKFWFDTREKAEDFVHGITVENCVAVSFKEDGEEMEVYDVLDLDDEDDCDWGWESNMPCDTYGPAACSSSCPNYARCQGWEK